MNYHSLDTSKELMLLRRGAGYSLVRPETILRQQAINNHMPQTVYSLGDILNHQFDVYLYNTNNQFQIVNEVFVTNSFSLSHLSPSSVVGKRPSELFANGGETLEYNNEKVFTTNEKIIFQEEFILNDETHKSYLSIKSPIFNEYNKLVGIFGASILLGTPSLADSLQKVLQLGMLQPNHYNDRPFLNELSQQGMRQSRNILIHCESKKPVPISIQQMRCLDLLMKGYSGKEIANKLGLSLRTVNHYLEALRDKLSCKTSKELIALYYRQVIQQGNFT